MSLFSEVGQILIREIEIRSKDDDEWESLEWQTIFLLQVGQQGLLQAGPEVLEGRGVGEGTEAAWKDCRSEVGFLNIAGTRD